MMNTTGDTKAWTVGAISGGTKSPPDASTRILTATTDWQPSDVEGFWIKPLHEDAKRGEKTMLMKVAPGAFAPSHTHPGEFEQCFVLEGSFYDQHGTLPVGGYCCREPNEAHETGSVDGAIVLLIYTDREKSKPS